MNILDYSDKTHLSLPSVTASPSSPKTLYHGATDLVYVNTGSGWSPMVQPSTGSVYSAYSGASASTQANILASVADVSAAPHAAHKVVAAAAATVAVRGR